MRATKFEYIFVVIICVLVSIYIYAKTTSLESIITNPYAATSLWANSDVKRIYYGTHENPKYNIYRDSTYEEFREKQNRHLIK